MSAACELRREGNVTNGRQLRYLSTSNEESAKLFMVIDLLLRESAVVMIDFVDALRSSMVLERTIHGGILGRWKREYIVCGIVVSQRAAGYGRLHRYLHTHVGSIPVLHALKPWFPSRWVLGGKLSAVSLGTSIKVKRRDEERQRRESSTSINHLLLTLALHIHIHIHIHILLFPYSHPIHKHAPTPERAH